MGNSNETIKEIYKYLTLIISETNGISISDTLELLSLSHLLKEKPHILKHINDFKELISAFHQDKLDISTLLGHPVSKSLFLFFKKFPLPYFEEHIHLTGSLSAEFIFPRIKKLLKGPHREVILTQLKKVYGDIPELEMKSIEDVDFLIRLQEGEQFLRYLKILILPKLILYDRQSHKEAAYHMANELYEKYNVGNIRLKFTLSRSTTIADEQIPHAANLTEEDVLFGLYDGFMEYKKTNPKFNFVLSPCFRKESSFYDATRFPDKKSHFNQQVEELLKLIEKHPELTHVLTDVDTVGDERELFRKAHFNEMKNGLRRLQYRGIKVRSHHGETWKVLRTGVQSVDNAMNIWHIDTLEHGLSIGINPNFYFQRIYQRTLDLNNESKPVPRGSTLALELEDMLWDDHIIYEKLLAGTPLTDKEHLEFIKVKFHTAREIEHYQHDVLNRMIDKSVSLVALPTSNLRLTGSFPDFKDHPFSWWEKKGLNLAVGTDNYITLSTNYIQELLILLYSDPEDLKITKLLMVASREMRRPYISHLLWQMRKNIIDEA